MPLSICQEHLARVHMKCFILSLLSCLLAVRVATAQCILPVEVMPTLASGGGQAAIMAAVKKNLVYPADAKRIGVEGRVFVSFTITTAGLVKNAHVVKSLQPDYDAAALRAVRKLPRFKPGTQLGRPVTCGMMLPIQFKLPR